MNAKQIRAFRISCGFTILAWSRIFGVTTRTVCKWEAGDAKVSGPAVTLCALLREIGDEHRAMFLNERAKKRGGGK